MPLGDGRARDLSSQVSHKREGLRPPPVISVQPLALK
jgi:hypothetical protein